MSKQVGTIRFYDEIRWFWVSMFSTFISENVSDGLIEYVDGDAEGDLSIPVNENDGIDSSDSHNAEGIEYGEYGDNYFFIL